MIVDVVRNRPHQSAHVLKRASTQALVRNVAEPTFESMTAAEDDRLIETPPDDVVAPVTTVATFATVAEASTNEPPPWALEMMEEMKRLRVENDGLRDALRGIRGLLDRQIGILQDGSKELERHVGEISREIAS